MGNGIAQVFAQSGFTVRLHDASSPAVERGLRRVARYADGWMTNKVSPDEFRQQWSRITAMAREEGRDASTLGSALYHNIHIDEDRGRALVESKRFLDTYYTSNFSAAFVEGFQLSGYRFSRYLSDPARQAPHCEMPSG